jgi:hypothetical protein
MRMVRRAVSCGLCVLWVVGCSSRRDGAAAASTGNPPGTAGFLWLYGLYDFIAFLHAASLGCCARYTAARLIVLVDGWLCVCSVVHAESLQQLAWLLLMQPEFGGLAAASEAVGLVALQQLVCISGRMQAVTRAVHHLHAQLTAALDAKPWWLTCLLRAHCRRATVAGT